MPVFQDDEVSAAERTAPLPVVVEATDPVAVTGTGTEDVTGADSSVTGGGADVTTGANPFDASRPALRPDPFAGPGPFDAPNPFDLPVRREPPAASEQDPAPAPAAGVVPPLPPAPPAAPAAPAMPPPSTGWTSVLPVVVPQQPQQPQQQQQQQQQPPSAPVSSGGLGAAPRGRILVVEGGYGASGRRSWGRGGANQAPVLSAMLAAVSPQMLLAADAVDAVHLPGANDPQTVLAHLRAASRHPGPLLVHFGGHLVADRRDGALFLTLRDSKAGDGLPWQAVVTELQHRSPEWQTLVIADLSADQHAWPQLQSTISPLADGIPLWAVVSPDPEQIGTFTRALIEALHGGRPGADAVLAPEQLRQQVYSVLRPDVLILTSHAPDRPVFRNTARRSDGAPVEPVPYEGPRPVAVQPRPAVRRDVPATPAPVPAAAPPRVRLDKPGAAAVAAPQVSLDKPGSAPRPDRPAVTLAKAAAPQAAPALAPALAPAPAPAVESAAVESAAAPEVEAPEVAAPEVEALRTEAPEVEAPEPVELAPAVRVTLRKVAAAESPAEQPAPAGGTVTLRKPAPESTPPEREEADPEATAELPLPAAAPGVVLGKATAAPDGPPAPVDYREAIGRIVRSADAGEHEAAAGLALELERQTVAVHGPTAAPVLQVRQVRAHVSRLAGRPGEAADLYREVALVLLRAEGAEHPETQQAATNAEACWRAIADRAEALKAAPEIIELRAYLPGPDGRKLRAAERYLAQLAAAPSED